MTDRDEILKKRENVREYYRANMFSIEPGHRISESVEQCIRRAFPLPPKTMPNVVKGGADWEWRIDPETDRLQCRYARCHWGNNFSPENEAAIRAVIAQPTIEVPDEEETPCSV